MPEYPWTCQESYQAPDQRTIHVHECESFHHVVMGKICDGMVSICAAHSCVSFLPNISLQPVVMLLQCPSLDEWKQCATLPFLLLYWNFERWFLCYFCIIYNKIQRNMSWIFIKVNTCLIMFSLREVKK